MSVGGPTSPTTSQWVGVHCIDVETNRLVYRSLQLRGVVYSLGDDVVVKIKGASRLGRILEFFQRGSVKLASVMLWVTGCESTALPEPLAGRIVIRGTPALETIDVVDILQAAVLRAASGFIALSDLQCVVVPQLALENGAAVVRQLTCDEHGVSTARQFLSLPGHYVAVRTAAEIEEHLANLQEVRTAPSQDQARTPDGSPEDAVAALRKQLLQAQKELLTLKAQVNDLAESIPQRIAEAVRTALASGDALRRSGRRVKRARDTAKSSSATLDREPVAPVLVGASWVEQGLSSDFLRCSPQELIPAA